MLYYMAPEKTFLFAQKLLIITSSKKYIMGNN